MTVTARSLYIPLFARAAKQPVIVLVADNRAAEALEPTLRAGCELTGAVDPALVVRLPAHDVLPFENLSPHPDVQEQRAAALFKLATGAVSILIAPVEAAALRLFDRDYYAGLAVTLKRGEEVDVEVLTGHLASVGYTQMDLVEMPGQFTRRGGILDVYSPEADRPVRIEFFGDEIETIRKFDPETQRSQSGLDETQLLPLTETPVTERLLAAVHARLSRQRIEGEDEEMAAEAAAAGGVSVFPGWEFFSAVAGAHSHLLKLAPKCALFVDEPAMVRNQIDRWWNKVEQRHERSAMGSLITPEDMTLMGVGSLSAPIPGVAPPAMPAPPSFFPPQTLSGFDLGQPAHPSAGMPSQPYGLPGQRLSGGMDAGDGRCSRLVLAVAVVGQVLPALSRVHGTGRGGAHLYLTRSGKMQIGVKPQDARVTVDGSLWPRGRPTSLSDGQASTMGRFA